MWPSMSRKPGQPANYLQTVYSNLLAEQQLAQGGIDKNPEIVADRLWESFVKKLIQKDYQVDAGFYGSLNEFGQKVAYFFHSSLQGTACYPEAAAALRHVRDSGLTQGLLADGQVFTAVQFQRGLAQEDPKAVNTVWVKAVGRLVEYEQAGPAQHRLGEGQALAHAHRVALDLVVGALRHPDGGQQLRDLFFIDRAEGARKQAEVVASGKEAIQRRLLKRCAEQPRGPRMIGPAIVSADPCGAAVAVLQPEEDADRGGLAGPVWPEETEYLSFGNAQ